MSELNIFNEKLTDNDYNKIFNHASQVYEHLSKFTHNKSKQSTQWVKDIYKHSRLLSDAMIGVSDKQLNSYMQRNNISMQSIYEDGVDAAAKKNPQCKGTYDVFEEFSTFDDLIDEQKIHEYLKKHARTREVIDLLEESTTEDLFGYLFFEENYPEIFKKYKPSSINEANYIISLDKVEQENYINERLGE